MTDSNMRASRFNIGDGRLEEYRASAQRLAASVAVQEPDMLHFGVSIDAGALAASTLQVHRTVANMASHMQIIKPMQPEGFGLIDASQVAVHIEADPTPSWSRPGPSWDRSATP
jgi:hypothetical protein